MDHADVRAWLEDAFFRPGTLRRLDERDPRFDEDPLSADVRDHLDACAECANELRALRATGVALDVGFGPSPAARERMLASVRQLGRQRGASVEAATSTTARPSVVSPLPRRATLPRATLLRAAAVVALLVLAFGAGTLVGVAWPGTDEPEEGPRLANAASMMSELLAEPDARSLRLIDSARVPAGFVVHSPSRQQLAVLTSALERPAEGRYECYLQRNGQLIFIGPMHFEDGTAFWAGRVTAIQDAGRAGDRFVVMHGPPDEPALWGQF